jgi:hypothetical protein
MPAGDAHVLIVGAGPTGLRKRAPLGASGLERDALYLLRPDGYVALANEQGDPSAVAAYLDARTLT